MPFEEVSNKMNSCNLTMECKCSTKPELKDPLGVLRWFTPVIGFLVYMYMIKIVWLTKLLLLRFSPGLELKQACM